MSVSPEYESLIEPEAAQLNYPTETQLLISIAVSLRSINKALTSDELLPALAASCNDYGENFAVALQEGLVRGANGISSYR